MPSLYVKNEEGAYSLKDKFCFENRPPMWGTSTIIMSIR